MDEAEAIERLGVPRETFDRLEAFRELLLAESYTQNLVSRASLADFWARHVLDSSQLASLAPEKVTNWVDLGTGAGFPGLIIALLRPIPVTLVEARRLRCDFLARAAGTLGVAGQVEILCRRLETVPTRPFDAISARAFAPLDKLLLLAERFSTNETVWILPKGRNAKSELDAALKSWQGDFRLEPSLTDPDARIIVARNVRRRSGKR